MPKSDYLGEFELMILLVVVRLDDDAYGVPISRELQAISNRNVSLGSVYAALDRLESKGHVTSKMADPTPERGGRAKRYFRATTEGLSAIEMTRATLTRLWHSLPKLKGARV